MIYYRLRIVDLDQRTEFSPVRIIRNEVKNETANILTYPNPVQNEVRITLPSNWQDKQVVIELYNSNGNVVKRIVSARAGQTESINLQAVNPGIYIVKASNGTETAVQRIVKSK